MVIFSLFIWFWGNLFLIKDVYILIVFFQCPNECVKEKRLPLWSELYILSNLMHLNLLNEFLLIFCAVFLMSANSLNDHSLNNTSKCPHLQACDMAYYNILFTNLSQIFFFFSS